MHCPFRKECAQGFLLSRRHRGKKCFKICVAKKIENTKYENPMTYLSTSALRRALELQIKIESMQHELSRILGGKVSLAGVGEAAGAHVSSARRVGRPKGSGRKRKAGRPSVASQSPKPAKVGRRKRRVSPLKGKKRSASPSGPLGDAVSKVMKRAGHPLSVNAVLEELKNDKYVWNVADPKKNLSARIYKLKGIRKVSPGLFDLVK